MEAELFLPAVSLDYWTLGRTEAVYQNSYFYFDFYVIRNSIWVYEYMRAHTWALKSLKVSFSFKLFVEN